MIEYSKPFKHFLIDDFLSPENFKMIDKIYRSKQFNLKHTDLFKFLQTDELASDSSLDFFKTELTNKIEQFYSTKNTFYTIFASFYRKGDYLSCHDDMVDGRLYAFTYYLSDMDSGDLILFNNECTKEFKRVGIKKNRLVIFEVSDISWHEVEICSSSGRMAITGWLNDFSKITVNNDEDQYILPKNIEFVDFDLDLSDNILEINGLEYNFKHSSMNSDSKLSMRRLIYINLDTYVAINIQNYNLVYINSYIIDYNSYILLNDTTNLLKGDLLDIFIIKSEEKQNGNIKLVDEEGVLIQTLKIDNNVMYVVKRGKMKYFLERGICKKEYFLAHLIYRKI